MMYMLMQQTRRNLKIFLKDKANIFFALLSPLIVLALYVLFLGRTQTDSMMEALTQMGLASAASEKAVQAFCDSWMLVGCLSCACVTVPMCACGSIIQDKKRGIAADLLASPIPKWMPSAAYFLSVLAAGLAIAGAVLVIGFVWLAASGSWYLSFIDVLGCIGVLILSVLSSSTLLILVVSFLRSEGAFTGLNVIVGTVIGFFIGAYMPITFFPKGIQYFTLFIPGSYSAGLFRNFGMGGALDNISSNVSREFADALAKDFSFTFDFFGTEIQPIAMALILAATVVVFGALNLVAIFVRTRRIKEKRHCGGGSAHTETSKK